MDSALIQEWYKRKYEELKDVFSIAETLIKKRGINLKEEYPKELYEHSVHVAKYAIVIGNIFNVKYQDLIDLATGALLHDYGKSLIDPAILYKKDKLTDMEFMLIQNHPAAGYRALKKYAFNDIVMRIVLMHHEKLNGTGYPLGENNPDFLVQIVTVADVFDAIHTKRCYHDSRSLEESINIISVEKGLNPIIISKLKQTTGIEK